MRDYGSFFKRERKFSGLSQKELAQGICSVKTISRIETGRQIPSPAQFSMLIERLGVSGVIRDGVYPPISSSSSSLFYVNSETT